MIMRALFRKTEEEVSPCVEEIEQKPPTISPVKVPAFGVNVIRVVQDHGMGHLADIDAEIAKYEDKIRELQYKRRMVVKLVQVFDEDVR